MQKFGNKLDEILADNFVHLVLKTKGLKSPQIVNQMQQVLSTTQERDNQVPSPLRGEE